MGTSARWGARMRHGHPLLRECRGWEAAALLQGLGDLGTPRPFEVRRETTCVHVRRIVAPRVGRPSRTTHIPAYVIHHCDGKEVPCFSSD